MSSLPDVPDEVPIEEFLKWPEVQPRKSLLAVEIMTLITNNPMRCCDIAKRLGRSYVSVYVCLRNLVKRGKVEKRYDPLTGVPLYCRVEENR